MFVRTNHFFMFPTLWPKSPSLEVLCACVCVRERERVSEIMLQEICMEPIRKSGYEGQL